MVTGSTAANYYAVPRMTRDIDIVVELGAADVETMLALFGNFYLMQYCKKRAPKDAAAAGAEAKDSTKDE